MGTVYRAEDARLGRKVAVKLIAPELAGEERFRERFLRESRLAASLDHPHIVPIHRAGEAEGTLYLAMRYVEGSDLAELIAEQGPLDPGRVVALLEQVGEALDAAHERGLVHRDVKPSNILIARAGGKEHAYLSDFGLSKQVSSLTGVSLAGEILGTIDYLAPEQIQGQPVDQRADVYALACLLQEALTGMPPFARATEVAALWAHVHEVPPAPSSSRPELGPGIDAALARGLAKHPGDRHASCGELLAEVRLGLGPGFFGDAGAGAVDLPAGLYSPTPLVGRAGELRRLRESWRRARQGHGRAVYLTGPTGIGKTRLAAELALEAQEGGAVVLHARCAGPAQDAIDTLRAAGSAEPPVLLVADDLDAAGGTVLELVRSLLDDAAQRPLLFLASLRDPRSPLVSSLLELADPQDEQQIELGPLTAEDVRAIASLYVQRGLASLPVAELMEKTGGVPVLVHREAAAWARERASGRLAGSAERAAAGRSGLRSAEAELAEDVIDLQLARDRSRLHVEDGDAPVVCPFKGLATFDAVDADYFFGRERLVAEMVARLVGSSFLGVVGPSGSGKSSAVRAGLVPALAAGVIPGSEQRRFLLVRPGEHPLRELERVLAGSEAERRLLVVDQFEEVFTACRDETERGRFVRALTDLDEEALVVLALRGDFYERCAAYPELARLLGANQVLVGPMQEAEFQRAIELPARRVGLGVEPGLTDTLVEAVVGEPGALPVLSTALLELWERRDGRTLTLASYRETGGVHGAVARLAEQAYGSLSAGQQQLARSILLRLAGEGDGDAVVRRRVPLAEFDLEHDEDAARVLAVLTDARLLTTGEDTVEVAHEALLREWPRLRGWLEEDAEGRRLHLHLIESAREWDEGGRDAADLYRGARLSAAVDWAEAHDRELNERERSFLGASRSASQRQVRRLRMQLAGVGVLLVAAVFAGAFALVLRGQAADEARLATARQLAASAQANLEADPELSILLAIEAAETTRSHDGSILQEAEQALHDALGASRMLLTATGVGRPGAGRAVAFAPDAASFVAADVEGDTATVRDAVTGETRVTLVGHAGPVLAVEYSPDGGLIATAGADGTTRLWAATGEIVRTLQAHPGAVLSSRFSADGERLVTLGEDRAVRVWHVHSGRELHALTDVHDRRADDLGGEGVAFAGSGRVVLAARAQTDVPVIARIFDLASGEQVAAVEHLGAGPDDIDVSPDGTLLAVADWGGGLQLWRLPKGELLDMVTAHGSNVLDVEFSRDGRYVATGSADGTAKVWEVARGKLREVLALRGQKEAIRGISLSHDATRLITWGGPVARVWDVSPAGRGEVLTLPGPLNPNHGDIKFTPDGSRLVASSGLEGTVRVWSTETGDEVLVLDHHAREDSPSRAVLSVDVSPDGSRIATGGMDGSARIFDSESGEELVALRRRQCDRDGFCGVFGVAFSRDGTRIATTGADGTVRTFAAESGRELRVLRGHVASIPGARPVQWSPDGERLLSVAADGIRIWDPDRGRELLALPGPGTPGFTAAWSPDGSEVLMEGMLGPSVWNAESGEEVRTLETGAFSLGLAFSRDGARVAIGALGASVRIWDWTAEAELLTLRPKASRFAFSPDGTLLAAVSDAAAGPPAVRVFALDHDLLLQIARERVTRSLSEEECRQYLQRSCPARRGDAGQSAQSVLR
jgi:WD40 repeat protein